MKRQNRGTHFSNETAKAQTLESLRLAKPIHFVMAITVQGDDLVPSTVTIQAVDHDGNAVAGAVALRVRLTTSADAPLANSTNGLIAVGANTTLLSTLTTDLDLVVRTHTDGKATITVTNETSNEAMKLRIGYAPIGGVKAEYTAVQAITHSLTALDAAHSTLTPTTVSIAEGGVTTTTLTVQARDASNDNLTTGGSTVLIVKDSGTGTISAVTDNEDGTYTAVVTSAAAAGSGVFSATIDGDAVGTDVAKDTATVSYAHTAVNAAHSTLNPTTVSIAAGGVTTTTLTVQARDVLNHNLTTAGLTVTVIKDSGTGTIAAVTDNEDGTYTAVVTSPVGAGSGVFSATIGGVAVGTAVAKDTATVTYTE